MKKRIISLLLVLVMVLSLVPAVSAASGTCGGNVKWFFDSTTGDFTISGEGDMSTFFEDDVCPWESFKDDIKRVIIQEGVTSVTYGAFQDCVNIQSVSFPSTMRKINGGSFYNTGVQKVVIPEGVTFMGDGVFANCANLESVELPTTMEGFSVGTFEKCPKLSTIIFPEMPNLESYGQAVFYGNPSLTNLDHYKANELGINMFDGCTGFTDLTLPEGVTDLHSCVFKDCTNLTKVTMPKSLATISGITVFSGCTSLTEIWFTGDAPESIDQNAFLNNSLFCYYPEDNSTWTEEVMQDYGGTITWVPYNTFIDVPLDVYYTEPVQWAVENGMTNGMTKTEFGPATVCNRAQVVTFLWRAAGSPAPKSAENPFVDVPEGQFYTDAVLWAVENGITSGVDATHFNPNGACSRAQVVTFLHRAAGSPAPASGKNTFADVPEGQFYTNAVLWAVENGITNGVDGTHFAPNTTCDRAQIVTFLYRANTN